MADHALVGRSQVRADDLDASIAIGVVNPIGGHLPNGERFECSAAAS